MINGDITWWKDALMQKYFNNIEMNKILSRPSPIGGYQIFKSIHQAFQVIQKHAYLDASKWIINKYLE
jgi:hypothetical protein